MTALYENTLAELVVRMLKVPLSTVAGYKGGTATGGSTSTLVDTSRIEADDYFQNTSPVSHVHILTTTDGAAPVGDDRESTDFANATGTITVSPNFSSAPAAGDTYVVLSMFLWDELAEAINMAIDYGTARGLFIRKIDESIVLQDDTYEYTMPEGFIYINKLSQEDGNGDYPESIPADQYKIIRAFPIPKIHFYRTPTGRLPEDHYISNLWVEGDLSDDKHLRIEGLGKQARLVDEWDKCYLDPNFVVYQAASFLHASRITKAESDYDQNRVRADVATGLAQEFLRSSIEALPPDSKRVYA